MKIVRETIIRPAKGYEKEVAATLEELGDFLATQPGFIEGYTLDGINEAGLLARISVWESRDLADRSAMLDHTIALRAKLQRMAQPGTQELLLEIVSERHAEAVAA
ncbi:MAG: hypothetical protein FJ039_05300 [Chloroflexi bacterium]|nr:hypothetical protein [Chloroflexota bacterium]